MAAFIRRRLDETGQGLVEYALIIAFVVGIAVYFMSGTSPLGESVEGSFDSAHEQIDSASGTAAAKKE